MGQVFSFLFTTLSGAVILALVGMLLTCLGIVGFFQKEQEKPTVVSVADLEKGEKPPKEKWVKINDAHIVWGKTKSLATWTTKAGSDKKENEKVSTYYVPVTSKAAVDAGAVNEKTRVFLKMTPDEAEKQFPEIGKELKEKKLSDKHLAVATKVSGLTTRLSDEEKDVREPLSKPLTGAEASDVLIVAYGTQPLTQAESQGISVCMIVFAVLFFLPLVLYFLRRGQQQPPPPDEPQQPPQAIPVR